MADDDDGDASSSSSSESEMKTLVKRYQADKAADKKRRRLAQAALERGDDAPELEEGEEEGELFVFDERTGMDGERRLKGVHGEEDLADDVAMDLGIQVEPFHLRDEMDSGFFTADGHYVEVRGVFLAPPPTHMSGCAARLQRPARRMA